MIYKATFPTHRQQICQGDGTYCCECILWAKREPLSNLHEEVLITCSCLPNKSFHMFRNKRPRVMHMFGGGCHPIKIVFTPLCPSFNVGICFKDARGHLLLPFLCTCLLSITVKTHQLSVAASRSSPNLEASVRGCLDTRSRQSNTCFKRRINFTELLLLVYFEFIIEEKDLGSAWCCQV